MISCKDLETFLTVIITSRAETDTRISLIDGETKEKKPFSKSNLTKVDWVIGLGLVLASRG